MIRVEASALAGTGRRVRRGGLIVGAAAVVVGITALVALGLWHSEASFLGGQVTAGDLQLVIGEPSWTQVTPGVTDPAGGSLGSTPEGFFAMPGDVIEVVLPVTTTLRGANLSAGLRVDASGADLTGSDLEAYFEVRGPDGEIVSERAALGQDVAVEGLDGTSAGVTAEWEVVVVLTVLGDYRWYDDGAAGALGSLSVGSFDVVLDQVRTGEGFGQEAAP